jgi:CubicO group peptidase (beta-lactamase class C family)
MKRLLWGLPLLLAACAAQPAPQPQPEAQQQSGPPRVRRAGAEVLFWSQEQRDEGFRAMERLFPSRTIRAGGEVRPLPPGPSLEPALGAAEIDRYIAAQNVAGLLVLHDGRVRLERHARGFGPEQRWTSFSVAKSFTSTLVGAALHQGHIRSLDDPVTAYVPELARTSYDGVTVRHVLTMTSGVRWNENYIDPESDIARMLSAPAPEGMDVTVAYLRNLPREAEPGTRWNYNTAETNLVGVIVARAVGKPLADYLSETVWRPAGMEADAFWQVDERGREIAGCCISARLRDYGRLALFVLDGGRASGRQIVGPGWFAEATRAHRELAPGRGYGYQWWTGPGLFSAAGIFGQSIVLDPARRLAIVTLSAWPAATDRTFSAAREAFTRRVIEAVEAERR